MRPLGYLLVGTVLATGAWAQETAHITVMGEGRVAAPPDMATITLGVTAEAETAMAAMDQTSQDVAGLIARLEGAGIAGRDIQTSGLSLNPSWNHRSSEPGPPTISGYTASNNVTVRVRTLDSLGGVLDEVLEAGANTFNGLSFGLQDPQPQEDEARQLAVADARRKAELLAEAAGVSLGRIVTISEAGAVDQPQPMFRMEAGMASDAVPVAAGETSVTARVTIVWDIGG